MISTVLIDLDDTLLENDIGRFLPAYLERLGGWLSAIVPAERMVPALLRGTRDMLQNRDPTRTLRQIFAARFYAELGIEEKDLAQPIEDFYRKEFPRLQELTGRREGALQLVQRAQQLQLEIVIATSPLFPRIAIEERLAWAGIPDTEFRYSLITSMEKMHFAKPDPAYYAEATGLLGRPPAEAAMLGNDPDDDLAPARLLGLPVFLISNEADGRFPSGDLRAAAGWLDVVDRDLDPMPAPRPAGVRARLRGYLGATFGLTADLTAESWDRRPTPEAWSPEEILCHLRDVDREVHLPRIQAILAQEDPFIRAIETGGWADERDYAAQSGPEALSAFADGRQEALRLLEALDENGWSRRARHSLLGPTTLAGMMEVVADHDRVHLQQLRAAIPKPPR